MTPGVGSILRLRHAFFVHLRTLYRTQPDRGLEGRNPGAKYEERVLRSRCYVALYVKDARGKNVLDYARSDGSQAEFERKHSHETREMDLDLDPNTHPENISEDRMEYFSTIIQKRVRPQRITCVKHGLITLLRMIPTVAFQTTALCPDRHLFHLNAVQLLH